MDAVEVAMQVTLQVLPKAPLTALESHTGYPENAGEAAGRVFRAVLKQVAEGMFACEQGRFDDIVVKKT